MRNAPGHWPPPRKPEYTGTILEDTPEDIEIDLEKTETGRELLKYFRLLPKELWVRHFTVIEKFAEGVEEETSLAEQQKNYMTIILGEREKAIVECVVSDEVLKQRWAEVPEMQEQLFRMLREVLTSTDNLLGAGTTAQVKRMHMEEIEGSVAVKYLLAPKNGTLSARDEHTMLSEVETITRIEEAEHRMGVGNHIRVPHPYFSYERGKFQCYGMEEVQGVMLETLRKGENSRIEVQDTIMNALRTRYASEEAREVLWKEIDAFVTAMHEVCLHGDIKDRNIMVDTEGRFYLIDFGQSVTMGSMVEKTRSRFDELADEERRLMRDRIHNILIVASATT
jgi:serine/threonine protein kinase